ncbi:alanine dehydrogenase/PNT domain-containing protein [Colletotrichum sublineola]|uniref:Saccharopine dehydrogenase [NAD(+), L-lysine-forming] n=1 Tax=Colletotrichum sublineola TaxID=1173701 RepID=A0A066XKZ8_COLSU|nr:alanine dehydrogenase/PNT domain-containing protein [Colletotrichum sublineola]KDN68329.1 putative alanine dehydrogenase/PNT domain-containing protein [Colletotrichum sublineola]
MASTVLHLRSETKPLEHRSALTPTTTKTLIEAGYTVNVERSPVRIFDDAEFEAVGANLVDEGSWEKAPADHIIVGLKELEEKDFPLKHVHVTFLHVYKGQAGFEKTLGRFPRGGGTLLDLEFLTNETGRRVAAFGYHAGFSGAALALENWAWQLTHPGQPFPSVESYPNEEALIRDVKKALDEGVAKNGGKKPRVIVIGALGRCGSGAVDMCTKAGVTDIIRWDIQETQAKPGPYSEITESDIFVNCIYLSQPIPPFVNIESLQVPGRKLSVVCDVSADTTNPHNPIPIYTVATTFDKPTVPVEGFDNPPLSVISIDHLPSLLPRESSEAFSNDLLPTLLNLKDWRNDPVWGRAEKLFKDKVATTLPAELQKREV